MRDRKMSWLCLNIMHFNVVWAPTRGEPCRNVVPGSVTLYIFNLKTINILKRETCLSFFQLWCFSFGGLTFALLVLQFRAPFSSLFF
jgi:hypothetical protein